MMRKVVIVAFAAVSLNAPGSLSAAGARAAREEVPLSLPDPATVVLPDLRASSDPTVVSNGWKYFFFHREGVGFEEAYADFADCFRFLTPNDRSTVKLNRFVPWNSKPGQRSEYLPSPYGLAGSLIGGMFEGTLARRDMQAKMRRCMETRGYTRYGVAEETWENVMSLPPKQAIAVLAKIASGPNFGGKVPTK